jgi:hypothetical protein
MNRAGAARAVRIGAALAIAATTLAVVCGCGAGGPRHAPSTAATAQGAGAPSGPAFGLTEDNAALLWSPQGHSAGRAGAAGGASLGAARFQRAREALTALHPRYVRLLIDWAALQPAAERPPALAAPASGCARAIGPCAAYAGVRDQLAAIASQQRAGAGFDVVIVIFGTPAWAAQPPSGCEGSRASAFSRAPSAAGLAAYRALIHALIALGAREGVALDWWAPWNEPNDPTFLGPQRSSCAAGAAALSPPAYAALARAMAEALHAEGGQHHLLIGELNAYESGSSARTSIAQFVAALPADVLCLSDVWSLHAYASRAPFAPVRDPVDELEAALDARGGCARAARIWVTEAGAGAPHPGGPRPPGAADERAGCLALATQLLGWYRDARVGAVFQYSFREDPAFPVGLIDARLSRAYPAYEAWLAWARARASGGAPPAPADACSA